MRTTTKLILSGTLITFLVVLTFAVFSLSRFYAEDLREEHRALEKYIRTFRVLLGQKGTPFRLAGGQLLLGDRVVSGDSQVADQVQNLFGGVATVFMGETPVSTNVLDDQGKRALGSRLPGPVYAAIFKEGRSYRGEALILGRPYLTAYDPIRDHRDDVIGALFVGVQKSTFQEQFNGVWLPIVIMLAVLLVSLTAMSLLLLKITRRSESAEADSLRFLRTLMDTIPSPIFYKDAEGRYLGFNKAFQDFVGIEADNMLGKTVHELWPKDLADKYRLEDQALLESTGTQMYEGSVVYADGTRHDVVFHKGAFYTEFGAAAGLVGVILDITERKAAEKETRDAYQRLHDIIEFLPDATFVVDSRQRVIAWNRSIEEMTGVKKEEIVGRGDYAYSMPFYGERRPILIDLIGEDPELTARCYPSVKRVGLTLYAETCIPEVGDRESRYIWGAAAPLFDNQGNRVGGIETMRDITRYKRVEAELRFKNLMQETQLETSIDGILAVDGFAHIVSCNRRFLEIFDIGQTLVDAGDDRRLLQAAMERSEDPPAFLETVRRIYEHPQDTSRDEVVLKDGTIIDRYSAPMLDTEGGYYGRVWYFRDVTEQKHAEQERLRFEVQRHHSQMMESFVMQLGHDMRTPLTPLFVLIPLIREKTVDPDLRTMIDICGRSVASIHELTEKALKLVKLSASTEGLLECVDLADAVEAYILDNEVALDRKEVVCENGIGRGLLVMAVPDQLRELFGNLISNAVRYSDPGGVISIRARQTPEAVTVEVHDDGIGIESADLERIFDEFYKVDQSRHDLGSPGLGLAICRRIIANHQGTIRAESAGKGCGTTVCFTLPLGCIKDIRVQSR